jgi:60 kDa SS-A/Ro ribonucleoprotein
MANTQLFGSSRGRLVPAANAINEAGGAAYLREPEAALALYAVTGCLNGVYYADAETQLKEVLALCEQVPAEFVMKTALYARNRGHMKDMPALLLAYLAKRDGAVLEQSFDRVIDNGRMLRNFVQIVRSGVVGRKSLGTRPKRLVQRWLETANVDRILSAAVGEKPSLADIVRMVHPKPQDAEREALYAWLIGKPYKFDVLPAKVREFEMFKQNLDGEVPDLPFQYLTAMPLTTAHWQAIARRASWQATRMNLNTFQRHDVFTDPALVSMVANRLRDPSLVSKARVFPYQLMTAYQAAVKSLPQPIVDALQDAMELATRNVPALKGDVVIAVDVSGSMSSPVSGHRKGATSVIRCVDVAALIAACLKRANPSALVLPFAEGLRELRLNPRDSVMTQAKQLAALNGGGTNVSAPLTWLNAKRAEVDLLVIVSDNQSWVEGRSGVGTATMRQWSAIKSRCPKARMVCIDLQPYGTSQTAPGDDILHVGGFGDAVFEVLSAFAKDGGRGRAWVERIEAVTLQ